MRLSFGGCAGCTVLVPRVVFRLFRVATCWLEVKLLGDKMKTLDILSVTIEKYNKVSEAPDSAQTVLFRHEMPAGRAWFSPATAV